MTLQKEEILGSVAQVSSLAAEVEPDRPLMLHYKAAEHPIGDVHPYYHDGRYYLNYLYNPGTFSCAQLVSEDLIHWKRRELMHQHPESHEKLPPYFGLSVIYDPATKLYWTFYVYHGVRASVSPDLLHWDFVDPQVVMEVRPDLYDRQSDPYVFWNESERCYWMVMTLRKKNMPKSQAGAVGYATSTDLRVWAYRGELYFPGDVGDPECPSMFTMGGKWYLLASYYDGGVGRPSYRISDRPVGPWQKPYPDCLDGKDLCAAESCFNGNKRLLFGWIPLATLETDQQHWGGHLALPREVYVLPDGRLGTRLETSVGQKIRGPRLGPQSLEFLSTTCGPWTTTLDQGQLLVTGHDGVATLPGEYERLDIEVRLAPATLSTRAGLTLSEPSGGSGVTVSLDLAHRRLDIRTLDGWVLSDIGVECCSCPTVPLRVIFEEDLVEAFLGDRYSLAARLPQRCPKVQVGLLVAGGTSRFENLNLYHLKSLSEC